MKFEMTVSLGALIFLASCTVVKESPPAPRPSDQEIEAQIRNDIARTNAGMPDLSITGIEINPAGTFACGMLTAPSGNRVIIASQDDDFSDDRRITAIGVVSNYADLSDERNTYLSQQRLELCQFWSLMLAIKHPVS